MAAWERLGAVLIVRFAHEMNGGGCAAASAACGRLLHGWISVAACSCRAALVSRVCPFPAPLFSPPLGSPAQPPVPHPLSCLPSKLCLALLLPQPRPFCSRSFPPCRLLVPLGPTPQRVQGHLAPRGSSSAAPHLQGHHAVGAQRGGRLPLHRCVAALCTLRCAVPAALQHEAASRAAKCRFTCPCRRRQPPQAGGTRRCAAGLRLGCRGQTASSWTPTATA
jgi:hypothetical protein